MNSSGVIFQLLIVPVILQFVSHDTGHVTHQLATSFRRRRPSESVEIFLRGNCYVKYHIINTGTSIHSRTVRDIFKISN